MIILGIETSCDETAAAVITDKKEILSNIIHSQDHHEEFGGVVPEIAARAHLKTLQPLVEKALNEAQLDLHQIDAIAATGGPGLIGGVIVGTMFAKGVAASLDIPYVAVNHLAGHALTVRLTDEVEFPYLLLLTSGGHCQFLVVEAPNRYKSLGSTIDDAAGEAFDKVGKMLGFSYPAGPLIEREAEKGDASRFKFPRPLLKGEEHALNFSFSGLKTAVRRQIESFESLSQQDKSDICASFQLAILEIFKAKATRALEHCKDLKIPIRHFVLAGGVAANQVLRTHLEALCREKRVPFVAPPAKLCTDNAAMIAWAGIELLNLGIQTPLDFAPRPRWPLDEGE